MPRPRRLPRLTVAAAPLLLLAACGGDSDPADAFRGRPDFLVAEPVRTDYDGTTSGLLTGRAASLADLLQFTLPAAPTAADLRTLAIKTSYTGLLDVTPAGGFGTWYGKLAANANKGSEYVAVSDDGSGTRNVTMVIGIPGTFDPAKPCIVAIPSSGSRPVYGELGTIGEWAYNKGCVAAMTDKGTGVGAHDLDRDLAFAVDGSLVTAGQRKDLTFNASLLGDNLAAFRAQAPNRVAMKHAHGKQNPEKDWGQFTLQAVRTAFYVLNKHFPSQGFSPDNTLVIASSISNGGASVLRAAEQDSGHLIDAVVAAEPQLNLPESLAGVQVKRGGAAVPSFGKPLLDYTTIAGLYQPCATQSPALVATSAFTMAPIAQNRCASLAALGLVSGTTLTEQANDALAKLRAAGWEPESDMLHDSHYGFEFTDLVSTTYANAYARASVADRLCGYSFAGIDASFRTPVPVDTAALRPGWATGAGLGFLAGAFNITADTAAGGPALYLTAVSPGTGRADSFLDGAACLRRLATAANVGTTGLSAAEQAFAARVRAGLNEVRVSGDLRGKPTLILHGRSDALLPVNHTSRPYAALNSTKEAASKLRYYEVTDANHFDALVGLYPRTLVPLHVYTLRALDLMHAHLTAGAALPPSQVVRATARTSPTTALADANLPAIAATPAAANQIAVGGGSIDVPN